MGNTHGGQLSPRSFAEMLRKHPRTELFNLPLRQLSERVAQLDEEVEQDGTWLSMAVLYILQHAFVFFFLLGFVRMYMHARARIVRVCVCVCVCVFAFFSDREAHSLQGRRGSGSSFL